MATISTLAVNLIARTSVFERRMKASRKTVKNFTTTLSRTSRGLEKFKRSVISVGSALRRGLAFGLRPISSALATITRMARVAALALLAVGAASVKIAADTEETANLFDISMGSMADSANKWVTQYSQSLGLFEGNTKKALSTFQLMLTSMGFAEDAAFDMSKGLVSLTNDIASLRNLSLDEAFTKVAAGLTGESEPLKRIGILLNETTIKQLAMKDATIKARMEASKGAKEFVSYGGTLVKAQRSVSDQSSELTELEKVQFRYKALLIATKRDQGDFKRTLDSTTNVFKIIKEQIIATGNTIGKVLTPQVTEVGIIIRDWLISNQDDFKKWATIASDAIGAVVSKLTEYFELAKQGDFEAIFKDLGQVFGDIGKIAEQALIKLAPKASVLGQAMANGFIAALEGTKLGKFLGFFGRIPSESVIPASLALGTSLRGGARVGQRTEDINSRIGTINQRATGQFGGVDRDRDILSELKSQTKFMREGLSGRDF